jgi:hypothetical protein
LRHYATSWKVVGLILIPYEVIEFFSVYLKLPAILCPGFAQPLTEINTKKCFWGIKCGRRISLTTSLRSVSQLYRKCGILDISQPYRPVTGIAILFTHYFLKQRRKIW